MSEPGAVDLMIRGVRIIAGERWSDPVDIHVAGGLITAVEPSPGAARPAAGAHVLDGRDHFAIPGAMNGHTHAHNVLVRATGDDRWLEMHMLRMSESSPTWRPDDFYAAAAVGALEMVRTGTTACVDMVSASGPDWREKVEAVMRAYRDVGIAATVAPRLGDISFTHTLGPLAGELPEGPRRELEAVARDTPIEVQIERIADLAGSLARARDQSGRIPDRVRLGVGPVNPVQCTDELLEACRDLCDRWDLAMQTHCMESKLQALASLGPSGSTGIDRLARLGLLRQGVSLVHAVWLSDRDMDTVAASGALVVHCPASNMKLGSGVAPVRRYLDHGVSVQLGTDGSGSGDNQNMFQAMWLTALLSHVVTPDPDRWISAPEAFSLATRSRFRDQPMQGALVAGATADIVLLTSRSTFLTPRVDPRMSLVYSEAGHSVRSVIANGRVVLEDGHSKTVDEASVIEAVDDAWQRYARDGRSGSLITRLEPDLRRLQQRLPDYPYPVERHPAVGVLS